MDIIYAMYSPSIIIASWISLILITNLHRNHHISIQLIDNSTTFLFTISWIHTHLQSSVVVYERFNVNAFYKPVTVYKYIMPTTFVWWDFSEVASMSLFSSIIDLELVANHCLSMYQKSCSMKHVMPKRRIMCSLLNASKSNLYFDISWIKTAC